MPGPTNSLKYWRTALTRSKQVSGAKLLYEPVCPSLIHSVQCGVTVIYSGLYLNNLALQRTLKTEKNQSNLMVVYGHIEYSTYQFSEKSLVLRGFILK